jgi:hypothetical protein
MQLFKNCCVLGCLLGVFTTLCAQEYIAIVKSVEGSACVKREAKKIPLLQGDRLLEHDIVQTEEKSRVGIIFHDGSTLSLGEKSYLNIKAFAFQPASHHYEFKLFMPNGTALFESGKIGTLSPESFEFQIPEGTIGIRGTKFLVEVK